MVLLQEALEFMVAAHRGQLREGTSALPYCMHPMDVVHKLRVVGEVTDESLLCAAALHDLLEETPVTVETLQAKFPARIVDLVVNLTRDEPTAAQIRGMDAETVWRLRADMLIAEVAAMPADAQVIKLADRLSNVEEAWRTRSKKKLERYLWQTRRLLDVIPEQRNVGLWRAVQALSDR
ncbi:MAG: HD domain-containing protein [Chthonomonas sp.]|nr:HD domain-containing protein [Chthonomonas sp.]